MRRQLPIDKKVVPAPLRDPRRCFGGAELKALIEECAGRCVHPRHRFSDLPYLSPSAHHIIFHSRGGITHRDNGLMLCRGPEGCHTHLHQGTMPLRLVYAVKQALRSGEPELQNPGIVSPDQLLTQIEHIAVTPLTPGAKFTLLNDVLIDANFLRDDSSRLVVFANTLLAKASVLNDGTPPVRRDLEATLESMQQRRAWSSMLARRAAIYARRLGDSWLECRGRHVVAVCYNARNRFDKSVQTHRSLIAFLDGTEWRVPDREGVSLFRARISREMSVCMAKDSHLEDAARSHARDSLEVAAAVGGAADIDDALVRCCEAETFLTNFSGAHRYLDTLYSHWFRMTDNLRAIVLKLHARLAMAARDLNAAEKLIDAGTEWCQMHGIHHQSYHFARLHWNIKRGLLHERSAFLT